MIRRSLPTLLLPLLAGRCFAQTISIPFSETYKGKDYVIVDVKLNGHGPYPFIFDTCDSTLVLDQTLLKTVHAVSDGFELFGDGGSRSVRGRVLKLKQVAIGNAVLKNVKCVKAGISGMPARGIIGTDLLNNFVVTVDFDHRRLIAVPESSFRPFGVGAAIKLDRKDVFGLPRVSLLVEKHPGTFFLDTGNEDGLLLHAPFVRQYKFDKDRRVIDAASSRTISGPILETQTRLAEVQIGPYALHELVVKLLTSDASADTSTSGNMGIRELRRFIWTFDLHRKLVYVRKSLGFDEPAREPRCGIIRDYDKPGFVVSHVVPRSPADEVGILPGDRVIQINGEPVTGQNDESPFSAPEGSLLRLTIDRQGVIWPLELVLRNLV